MADLGNWCKARTLTVPRTPTILANLKAKIGICLKASRTNQGSIYFGESDVDTKCNGYELLPGDTVFLPIENSKCLYMIAVLDDDKASYFVI